MFLEQHLKITYASSVEKMCEVNSSFDRGILKVAYTGRNRNGSSISKDAFERSMSTIYNCPIVCNYNRERDEIGSHDVEVVVKDGEAQLVNITQPCGVIPESAQYWWTVIEDDAGPHEYLCIEALIWKRQEVYEKIKSNLITDESMEIRVKSGHTDEDGFYVIDSFEFLAFCLLESAPPCYESASLEMFGLDEFRQKYVEMMDEFKSCFNSVNTSAEVDIHKDDLKGGRMHLDEKIALLAKFGLTEDQLDFDITDMSIEDLECKLNSIRDQSKFSLTAEQFRDELIASLSAETVEREWGTVRRYCYCDYDTERSEVYCYDVENWNLYGMKFSLNGDHVVIDFDSKTRKKFAIVDFEEGTEDFSMKEVFDTIAEDSAARKAYELNTVFSEERSGLEEKYSTAAAEIEQLNSEIVELRQYQQTKLSEERKAAADAVFAMFTDLSGIEAFETLRADYGDMPLEDIEDKCFAIRGRNNTKTFSVGKTGGNVRLPVAKEHQETEPYGGLFIEFPPAH